MLAQVDARYAAAGWILTLPFIGALALRWQVFLRQQKIDLPFLDVLSLTWGGQFFNSFLPGSTGGDVVKIYQLCRAEPTRKAAAAATVIADRVVALVALLFLAGVASLLDPAPLQLLSGVTLPIKAILLLATLGGIAARRVARTLRAAQWMARLSRLLKACRDALAFNSRLAAASLLGLAVHLLNFTVIYFYARALHLSITYSQVLLMMPVILFLLLIPVTINGHGLREVLLIGYFSYFRVHLESESGADLKGLAVALSLLIVANDLCWSVPGGIWYFKRFARNST